MVTKIILIILIVSSPSHDIHAQEKVKKAIYECWKYNLGFHAYFAGGSARGAEIKRIPSFSYSQLMWNSLRFQLRSKKNTSHGRDFNEMMEHWLPPSASRRSIICNMLLYPVLEHAGLTTPGDEQTNSALSDMFANTMRLKCPLSPKLNRDFMSVLVDYIAPRSLAKTSTTPEMASLFHHSPEVHNDHYSATTFRRDRNGKIIHSSFIAAQEIWHAIGETNHQAPDRPTIKNRILTIENYNDVAKRAYRNPHASVNKLQYSAIAHASSPGANQHAFILMGCGTGKSGIYNLLLLGAYLHMTSIPRCIVISPHNSLLAQHKMQSRQYLRGTNLRVESLLPSDILSGDIPKEFDLLFISIHALSDMMDPPLRHLIHNWNLTNIFIDEYHNVIGELFRYPTSWASLRMIASLNVKIMCLSATSDKFLMEHLASFMALGKYVVIGDTAEYPTPNVKINITSNVYTDDPNTLIPLVVRHCRDLVEQKHNYSFKIHAITMSKADAKNLSDGLNSAGINSMWLTSDLSPDKKTQVMHLWEDGPEQVLVSTFVDGIDNSSTEDVIIVGATHSLYSLVQAIGRIRPSRQDIKKATVHIFHSKAYTQINNIEVEDNISKAIGAGVLQAKHRDPIAKYYRCMFSMNGYKNLIEQKNCIRRVLYRQFQIPSLPCEHCTNCTSRNIINQSAIHAQSILTNEQCNIQIVVQALTQMEHSCYICLQQSCNGIICRQNQSFCFACHGSTKSRNNVHLRKNCPVIHPTPIITNSQSCSSCYLAISNHIPNRALWSNTKTITVSSKKE